MKKIEYRERALKILPWGCPKYGRDFPGKNLRELTVHHKDHNYMNNPSDSSNWELLCIYCHDEAHERLKTADAYAGRDTGDDPIGPTGHRPFANLAELLKQKK